MFIDTHAHLNLDAFAGDYKETISRAFDSDVKTIINVGADYASSKRAVEIAKEYESGIYATVGQHPDAVSDDVSAIFNEKKFSDLLYSKRVVAIGEIGLDYMDEKVDYEGQKELLKKQIDMALKFEKPIVVHCREAYVDLISILKSYPKLPQGVIHCYVGNLTDAQEFIALGFLISFTGIITFSKTDDLIDVVKNIPLEKIMIETDSPWLAPVPHRGHRNEPTYVIEIAKKIAEIKNLSLSVIESQTTQNAKDLFKI